MRILVTILILFSSELYAICLQESDAIVYGCIPIQDSHSGEICQKEHGQDFAAYYLSDSCTEELAAELRGEEYIATEQQPVEAACFTFETGQNRGCQIWDFEPAYNYCANLYGDMYRPHMVTKTCSLEAARKEYGFVSEEELMAGLAPRMAEINAILTMIDRQGMGSSLQGYISVNPIIGNNFYTPVMQGLLAKMSDLKDDLKQRSLNKIDIPHSREFFLTLFQYMEFVNRVNKIYAYVAHRNHQALSTYNFTDLSFLDLELARPVALEVLGHVNFHAQSQGDTIRLSQSQQNKQMFEYQAISEPKTEVDYAKLVTFLGIRENLTNLWAVDRMSSESLLNKRVRSCGNFMSFRGVGKLKNWKALEENIHYDVFYNDYLAREEEIKLALFNLPFFTEDHIPFLLELYKIQGIEEQIKIKYEDDINSEILKEEARQDAEMLALSVEADWQQFSSYHFTSFVMIGDGVLEVENIEKQIFSQLYKRKREALIKSFLGLYPWLSNEELKQLSDIIGEYADTHLKSIAESTVHKIIERSLKNYNDRSLLSQKNYDNKIEETYLVAKKYAKYGKLSTDLDRSTFGAEIQIQPASTDQLMLLFESKTAEDFQDLKLTMERNPRLAGVVSDFFGKVIEKFNQDHLEVVGFNQFELKGTDEERALALWNALYDTAREYYLEHKFEITTHAMVPEATRLARDREKIARSPYMIEVYRDGTPVTVPLREFYEAFGFELGFNPIIARMENQQLRMMGIRSLDDYGQRNIPATRVTDGSFDQPLSYVKARGRIQLDEVSREIDSAALRRLYNLSLDKTHREILANAKLKREQQQDRKEFEEDLYEDVEVIKDTQTLFARIFELFEIPMGSIASGVRDIGFRLSFGDKKKLVKAQLAKAYGEAPLLRNRLKSREGKKHTVCTGYLGINCKTETRYKDYDRSLLEKIGYHALGNSELRDDLDESLSKRFIREVLAQAKAHIPGKIEDFCAADYLDYRNDEPFKKAFKASIFLRNTLRSDAGTSLENSKIIQQLDEKVSRDIRTFWQAQYDDLIEPALMVLGGVTLVAVLIMFSVSSFGAALPATLTTIVGIIGKGLMLSNYVFLPLVIASTFVRVNTQYIEVPAQLKFQKSLAHSQIDFSRVADYETIDQQEKENKIASYWTMGFLPLDLYFGYTVGVQVRNAVGVGGVKAYQRLTGIKLRGYSAPPKSLRQQLSFREHRLRYGTLRGAWRFAGQARRNVLAKLPRYQAIPESMIKTGALRQGIARKIKEIGMGSKPWVIGDEIKSFNQKIKDRLTEYRRYVVEEEKVLERYRLNGRLHFGEVMEHGIQNTKFGYTIGSFFRAIAKRDLKNYLDNYGDLIRALKEKQGQFVQQRIARYQTLLNKIDDFKRLQAGEASHPNAIDDLLRTLTDEEIALIEQVAKKSNSPLRQLKKVFSDHQVVIQSLRPLNYAYGQVGAKMGDTQASHFLRDDALHNYTYESDAEDLVNFYESMLRQNAFDDEASKLLRRDIEERISRLFRVDANGKRVFL